MKLRLFSDFDTPSLLSSEKQLPLKLFLKKVLCCVHQRWCTQTHAYRNTIRAISSVGGGEKAWDAFEPFTHGNVRMVKFNSQVCTNINIIRAISSVGRAAHLHCEGREFEPLIAHMKNTFNFLLKVFFM